MNTDMGDHSVRSIALINLLKAGPFSLRQTWQCSVSLIFIAILLGIPKFSFAQSLVIDSTITGTDYRVNQVDFEGDLFFNR